MARNIEIKARIDSVEALRPAVAALADRGPELLSQDDSFFDCAHGRLKLRCFADGSGELIAYQRANTTGPKTSDYLICPTPTPDLLREALTRSLGLIGRVRKQRIAYFVGQTRVHLDRVESLGDHLELEVVLADGQDIEQGMQIAHELLRRLHIAPGQLIAGAYLDLLKQGT